MKQFNLKIVLTVVLVLSSITEARYLKQQDKINTKAYSEADLDFDPVFLEAFKDKRTKEMKEIQGENNISFLEKRRITNGTTSNKPGSVQPTGQNAPKKTNKTQDSDKNSSIPKATMEQTAKNKQESAKPPQKTEKLEPGKSKDQNLIQNDQKRYEAAVEKKLEAYAKLTDEDKAVIRENYSVRRFKTNDPQHKKKLIRSSIQVIIHLSKAFADQGKDESKTVASTVPEDFNEPEGEKILVGLLNEIPNLPNTKEGETKKIEMQKLFTSGGNELATNLQKLVKWFKNPEVETRDKQYWSANVENLKQFKTELSSDKLEGIAIASQGPSVSIHQGNKDVTQQVQNGQTAATPAKHSETHPTAGASQKPHSK